MKEKNTIKFIALIEERDQLKKRVKELEDQLNIDSKDTQPPKYKLGEEVRVISNNTWHGFKIGDISTIQKQSYIDGYWLLSGRFFTHWLTESCFEKV